MDKLSDARRNIDIIDEQMTRLFEKRMQAVEQVVEYKLLNGLDIFDSRREKAVIERNTAFLENDRFKASYEHFIKGLMDISKQYQRELTCKGRVGYCGVPGAFAHIAAEKLFGGAQLQTFLNFEDIFWAIEANDIEYGVLPFENSYTGEVGEVLDLLFSHSCCIDRIFDLSIEQNLLSVKGACVSDIKQVYSHPQALSQCKRFLDMQKDWELVSYANTAMAAQYVKEQGDKAKAAVASIETARLYSLDVLVPNINTSADNTTRFVVIKKDLQQHAGGSNRFSIMFTLKNNAGELLSVIQIIARHGFNMECIKSKPIHKKPWQYYFFVELEGDICSENAQELARQLKESCNDFKVIGAYDR